MPFVSMLLLLALQSVSAPKPVLAPTPKPAADGLLFKSEPLHLSYALPSGILAQTNLAEEALKEEQDKATGAKKAVSECVSIPLLAIDESDNFRMVSITRIDQTCLGSTTKPSDLGALTKSVLSESLRRLGDQQVGTPIDYKLGDHSATLLIGTAKSEKYGMTFHAAVSCALVEKDVACWEYVALSPEVVAQLVAIPVHFDGHDPIPVIPAEIFTTAK